MKLPPSKRTVLLMTVAFLLLGTVLVVSGIQSVRLDRLSGGWVKLAAGFAWILASTKLVLDLKKRERQRN